MPLKCVSIYLKSVVRCTFVNSITYHANTETMWWCAIIFRSQKGFAKKKKVGKHCH